MKSRKNGVSYDFGKQKEEKITGIAAVLELYTAFRIPQELEKEKR